MRDTIRRWGRGEKERARLVVWRGGEGREERERERGDGGREREREMGGERDRCVGSDLQVSAR